MSIKKLRVLQQVLKITGMWTIIESFVMFYLLCGIGILIFEPTINSYADALWYLFASFTTIGYGDFSSTTHISRIITVIVALYGILVVAFIPAVIMSYYSEITKFQKEDTMLQLRDKLENLSSLSKEELDEISHKIKEINK